MKKLTDDQVLAILSLSENVPSIDSTSISNGDHGVWVTIFSKINADWNKCDMALNEIFPKANYEGEPNVHINEDGSFDEVFHLSAPSGVHITLYMEKAPGKKETAPAPTGATLEISQANYTTESEVVANA